MSESRPASTTALDTTDQHKLVGLVEKINENHQACEAKLCESVHYARACGKLLVEAKKLRPRGHFRAWVEETFAFSLRTAQMYMRVHINWKVVKARLDKGEVLSLGQVNRLLAAPRPESKTAAALNAPPAPAPADPVQHVLRNVKPSQALGTIMKRHRLSVKLPTLLKLLVDLKFDAKLIVNKLNSLS